MKLIVTDMDGTLLNDRQEVSKENAQAVRDALADGRIVAVATGRDLREARLPLQKAGLELPIISVNGAQMHNEQQELVAEEPLSRDLVREAIEVLRAEDVYFEVYTTEGAYSDNYSKALAVVVDVLKSTGSDQSEAEMLAMAKKRFENGSVKPVDSYEKLIDQEHPILKLLAFSLEADQLNAARDRLKENEAYAVSASAADNLEITHQNAQKGIALEALANSKGVSLADCMALGDNLNDVSMFQKAGTAVAMGNAEGKIQEECHYVTKTNEEHGVAHAIYTIAGVKMTVRND
ncbi:Cof-type HAD-IIB family hydrolase [Shouchella shacheensis]|uniref:Cof-type HAD-IIB family hydrolase n=1 Tax=Shouchella shacheensis TaxID=1649580 RepID=UPI00073FECA1|nr:Cof-type HAD-IIB family hydrolase [Shouchella shacheensis]